MSSVKIKNVGGRPAGRKKTAKIEISIEPKIKEEFMTIVHNEGRSASVEIGNWIRQYIQEHRYNN